MAGTKKVTTDMDVAIPAPAVSCLAAALPGLKAPFAPEDVKTEIFDGKEFSYVDWSVIADRLDAADPDWSEFTNVAVEFSSTGKMIAIQAHCMLTVCGVTRTGDTAAACVDPQEYRRDLAGAATVAFNRAAAKFGVGRYLYTRPAAEAK